MVSVPMTITIHWETNRSSLALKKQDFRYPILAPLRRNQWWFPGNSPSGIAVVPMAIEPSSTCWLLLLLWKRHPAKNKCWVWLLMCNIVLRNGKKQQDSKHLKTGVTNQPQVVHWKQHLEFKLVLALFESNSLTLKHKHEARGSIMFYYLVFFIVYSGAS